jgi:Gpi18-like mannosyltransferase
MKYYSTQKKIATIILFLTSLALRITFLPQSNLDMATYNLRWYNTIVKEGIGYALRAGVSNYNPPYTYLLSLATLSKDIFPPLIAIKLIPTFFDILGAFVIYKLVKLKNDSVEVSVFAASVYFLAPSILLNSSYWGQVDSLYTFFLLISLYYILTDRPVVSLLAFGLSFSVKAQAVFFLPFLVIIFLQKRISLKYFGIIPIVYTLVILPVVILGRPVQDAFLVYIKQSDTYHQLSRNAPNLYLFFRNEWYTWLATAGIALAAILLSHWIYKSTRTMREMPPEEVILVALISVALTPFLLPKMHDRYFYPADVLSIVLAFYNPALWFVPLLYQIISVLSISAFLFNTSSSFVVIAAFLNTISIFVILKAQKNLSPSINLHPKIMTVFSWLYSTCISVWITGICLMLILQPLLIRIEYNIPGFPNEQITTKSERYKEAAYVMSYLTSQRKEAYLSKLELDNGSSVFNSSDIEYLKKIKQLFRALTDMSILAGLATLIITLFAWKENWLTGLLHTMFNSDWVVTGLTSTSGTMLVIIVAVFADLNMGISSYLGTSATLKNLFPLRMWLDAILLILVFTAGLKYLLSLGWNFFQSRTRKLT